MIHTLLSRLPEVGSILKRISVFLRKKIIQTTKSALYWSGVSALGLVVAGVIFVMTTHPVDAAASDYGRAVLFMLTSLVYYLVILPIGLASYMMAYIFEMVVNYPFGDMWTSLAADNSTAREAFVSVPAVIVGWKLVRDVCNIFFSIILVIIALANVLKIEAYSWKKLLPKFVLMAILINFSKTIAGVFTDVGTVAMATFGGSFSGSFGAAVVGAFGLPTIADIVTNPDNTSIIDSSNNGNGVASIMLAYLMTGGMTMLFFIVITIFTAILIFRIIMLWFLIVMSPLAYVTRILPQTEKHAKEWWERFGRWVTVGPLITFFLWLSLSFAFGTTVGAEAQTTSSSPDGVSNIVDVIGGAANNSGVVSQGPTTVFKSASPSGITNFMIAILMMMASLQIVTGMAKEAGKITGLAEKFAWGAGGAILGGGVSWLGLQALRGANSEYLKNSGKFGGALSTVLSGIGNTQLLAGATAYNPKIGEKLEEGIKGYSASKGKQLKSDVTAHNEHLTQGGRFGAFFGALASFGLRPEWAFANYVDPKNYPNPFEKNLGRILGSFRNQGTLEAQLAKDILLVNGDKDKGILGLTDILQNENTNAGGKFNRYETNEEAREALRNYQVIQDGLGTVNSLLGKVSAVPGSLTAAASIDLETNQPAVQEFVKSAKETLNAQRAGALKAGQTDTADDIAKQIKALDAAVAGDKVNMADLLERGTYDTTTAAKNARKVEAAKALQNNFAAQKTLLQNASAERESKLMNSSGLSAADLMTANAETMSFGQLMSAVDVTSPPDKKGKMRTFAELRTEQQAAINALNNQIKAAQTQLATYRPLEDLDHAAHTAHAVSDASKKIAGIGDSGVLMDRLAEAIGRKDRYLAEAIVKKITAGGDLDQLTTLFMQRYGINDGAANADGLEQFREQILQGKLGMSHHDSFRIANDVSLDAGFNKRQQAFALAYKVDASTGHLIRMKKVERDSWTAGEFKKKSIRELIGYGAAQWGEKYLDSAGNIKFRLDAAGLQLVKAFQNDLSDHHYFSGWSPDAKKELSDPEVLKQLADAGINEKLIGQLRDYRAQAIDAGKVKFAA